LHAAAAVADSDDDNGDNNNDVFCVDFPNLRGVEVIEDARQRILSTFRAYTTGLILSCNLSRHVFEFTFHEPEIVSIFLESPLVFHSFVLFLLLSVIFLSQHICVESSLKFFFSFSEMRNQMIIAYKMG